MAEVQLIQRPIGKWWSFFTFHLNNLYLKCFCFHPSWHYDSGIAGWWWDNWVWLYLYVQFQVIAGHSNSCASQPGGKNIQTLTTHHQKVQKLSIQLIFQSFRMFPLKSILVMMKPQLNKLTTTNSIIVCSEISFLRMCMLFNVSWPNPRRRQWDTLKH